MLLISRPFSVKKPDPTYKECLYRVAGVFGCLEGFVGCTVQLAAAVVSGQFEEMS
jgi:hypothetical protein